jgi:transposase
VRLGSIGTLHKRNSQSRRPKFSLDNPHHVELAKSLVEKERQNLKVVAAKLSDELVVEMHPKTLKRFLKT